MRIPHCEFSATCEIYEGKRHTCDVDLVWHIEEILKDIFGTMEEARQYLGVSGDTWQEIGYNFIDESDDAHDELVEKYIDEDKLDEYFEEDVLYDAMDSLSEDEFNTDDYGEYHDIHDSIKW